MRYLGLCWLLLSMDLAPGAIVESLDFESGAGVGYATSVSEFSDGTGDYFQRTDGSSIGETYNSANGYFFAAQDTDAEVGGASTVSLFVDTINISTFSSLSLSFDLAEASNSGAEGWDIDSSLQVYAQIDGGSQIQIFGAESILPLNGDPHVDSDLDTIGDGTEITDTFANLSANISGTGSTLDLEFRFVNLEDAGEDIALDNIVLSGVAAVPESALTLALLLLSSVIVARRHPELRGGQAVQSA